jgi:hypothetical protein
MRTIRPAEERGIDDHPTKTPTPTTHTKAETWTGTIHTTIVAVEERAVLPIEGVPSWTMKPKPTTKTGIGIMARSIIPIQERSFLPIEDGPTFTVYPHPTSTIKTKTFTKIKPTLIPI